MSLVPFLRTPAFVEDTPALQAKAGKADISSTGLQKLGQLNLRTQQKQQQDASTVAPTLGRPAVPAFAAEPRWGEASPTSDDDFVISMSQTYQRTQPDPCDYGTADHDEVELSLRRTQNYHAAGSTQHYSQHHHDFLLATAAAAALDSDAAAAAVATSTAEAWEASLAQASAFGGSTAADLLPPNMGFLEGQGSNKPGNTAMFAEAALIQASEQADRQLLLLQQVDFHPLPALPAVSCGPAQTPELQVCGGGGGGGAAAVGTYVATTSDVADDGTTPPLQLGLPLFPIFTQGRARRRPIYLIRHGESEYNLACKRRGGFGDPNDIFDARLTATGEKQARGLRPQLLELMQQHGDPLFIVSPLSRAIETFLHMLPDPERLRVCPQTPPPGSQQLQAEPHLQGPGSSCTTVLAAKPLNMIICPFLAEFLLTSGDVGRHRAALVESYPQIAEQLRKGLDKERWWYENAGRGPNCAIGKVLTSMEPDKSSKARVDRFRQFVLSQPHRPVVVVGHANFFKSLTHDSHYMSNCQMMTWAP